MKKVYCNHIEWCITMLFREYISRAIFIRFWLIPYVTKEETTSVCSIHNLIPNFSPKFADRKQTYHKNNFQMTRVSLLTWSMESWNDDVSAAIWMTKLIKNLIQTCLKTAKQVWIACNYWCYFNSILFRSIPTNMKYIVISLIVNQPAYSIM